MSAGSGASNLGYGNVTPFSNIDGQYVNVGSSQYAGNFTSTAVPNAGLSGAVSNIDAAAGKVPTVCMKGGLKRKIKNITRQYKRMKRGSRRMKSIRRKLRHMAASGGRRRRTTNRRRSNRRRRASRNHRGGMDDNPFANMSETLRPLPMRRHGVEDTIYYEERNNPMDDLREIAVSDWDLPPQRTTPPSFGQPLQAQAQAPAPAPETIESIQKTALPRRRQRGGYAQYQNNYPSTTSYSTGGITLGASESALANPVPFTKLSNCTNCVDNYNHYTNKGFPSEGH